MADNTQIVPTELPPANQPVPGYSFLTALQPTFNQQTTPTSSGSGGSSIWDAISGAGSVTPFGMISSALGGISSGLGQALAASAVRKQKEKLIAWQIAQAKSNLSPTALSQQGKYINPYTQQNTDAYQNATMGNLLSKFGSDQLAKWGISAAPVSSASEVGSTANQMAQYGQQGASQMAQYGQQGASQALLAKYGLA